MRAFLMERKLIIEKNIPFPMSVSSRYPFRDMEIGDSFFVATNSENDCKKIYRAIQAAKDKAQKTLNREFRTRKTESGYRTWRVL